MASLGVFIRDMPQINQLALTTWMYLTPIFYPENIIYWWFQRTKKAFADIL